MPKYDNATGNLADLLETASERASRPRLQPRDVYAQLLQNTAAGVGAAGVAWVGAYWLAVPWALEGALTAGAIVGCGLMIWRGMADEIYDMSKLREIKRVAERMVTEAQKRLTLALDALDALEAERDDLRATVERMKRDHELTQLELGRAKEQLQPKTWTPAVDPNAGVKADAMEIITHYFQTGGKWYSRAKAEESGWTGKRHAKAQALLIQADIIRINVKQPLMLARSLDEAVDTLLTFMRKSAAYGPIPGFEGDDSDENV